MYFEIDNTPENVRRARRAAAQRKPKPEESVPRLIVAPFSRPPQLVFENIPVGTRCEKILEIFNPTNNDVKVTHDKELPQGLELEWPSEWISLEPQTCYEVTVAWTPLQPAALRNSITFFTETRAKYNVVIVLKTAKEIKTKPLRVKGFKTSPGKIKKKTLKRSPVSMHKKKTSTYNHSIEIKNITEVTKQYNVYKSYNKENVYTPKFDDVDDSIKCPFEPSSSVDFRFDMYEVFSSETKSDSQFLQKTFEKNCKSSDPQMSPVPSNVLKPRNRNFDVDGDIFDNLTFTPLKNAPPKTEKLKKCPHIVMSLPSESEFDDSLDIKHGDNETTSVQCMTSQVSCKRDIPDTKKTDFEPTETPSINSKKIPNTSSPKDLHSPNFTLNTDFSRISDLSFMPHRFSTEKKVFPKNGNETHEICDENIKVGSDTFTKDSPNGYFTEHQVEAKQTHIHQQHKVCRQSLIKEFHQPSDFYGENNFYKLSNLESDVWQNQLRVDNAKSPPRSLTPPLQSIPEESTQFDSHFFDKSDKQTTFTINRTFNKSDRNSMCPTNKWSKKAIKTVEPEIWKVPAACVKKTTKTKTISHQNSSAVKLDNILDITDKNITQNISYSRMTNVYSQSLTVDPFLSATYFFDEEAVEKFELEFKKWLNYILTPPADLESNVEHKIDLGKAWIENKNKDVPLAPTKEKVCIAYHNSKRLDSLRRAARNLLHSPEISQVIEKLVLRIDKKLICIRNDKNLHLDVGLQKIIMELLLSYNPLWLRIGLEAIYGLVIPLKSNDDVEGLTTFIIQRMFKNPFLKNKHSKSSAPNMLLPAYIESLKKFTMKKFFTLVYFLDQAKERKLIQHDPCLFCRNAVCKESREVIIRFTRELIAGIGDITKQLRPLGYVLTQKQSYLDEYKYAVNNIAVDIRDGVRLTKVMEIILMKNDLLKRLRTPAISRLQKIHNVQLALTALKEANFNLVGDINANDIADGHREKTLSLLWQLIHEFRAPLFETAAQVIQLWWRKKYKVIIEERQRELKIRQQKNDAAYVIQCWWRRIQYNRYLEKKMQEATEATVVLQRYFRMWRCRSHYIKIKYSVRTIERWYTSVKLIREARMLRDELIALRVAREQRRVAAIKIQSYVRSWLAIKKFKATLRSIILIQSIVRCINERNRFLKLKKTTLFVQTKYKAKLLMKTEKKAFKEKKQSAIKIQSYYRMFKQRELWHRLKNAVITIENRYMALVSMRKERYSFLKMKSSATLLQAVFRGRQVFLQYKKTRNSIVTLQRRFRANCLMKQEQSKYKQLKNAVRAIEVRYKALIEMRKQKQSYLKMRCSAICLQAAYRGRRESLNYKKLRNNIVIIQRRFRANCLMKQERSKYIQLKNAVKAIEVRYKALIEMRKQRKSYLKMRCSAICLQAAYRGRRESLNYKKMRNNIVIIQRRFRANCLIKQERSKYIQLKNAVKAIEVRYKALIEMRKQRKSYLKMRCSAICLQAAYRGRRESLNYKKLRNNIVIIQRRFRANCLIKQERSKYIQLKNAVKAIEVRYKALIEMRKQRKSYLKMRCSAICLQAAYRGRRESLNYKKMRNSIVTIQRRFRANCIMRQEQSKYIQLKNAVEVIEVRYKALIEMRKQRKSYLKMRRSAICLQAAYRGRRESLNLKKMRYNILTIQRRFRANCMMKQERAKYIQVKNAVKAIEVRYKALIEMRKQRKSYLKMRCSAICLQAAYRGRRESLNYKKMRYNILTIQRRFRANCLMKQERSKYIQLKNAVKAIEVRYKALIEMRKQRKSYLKMRCSAICLQAAYRGRRESLNYKKLRNNIVIIQRRFRANCCMKNDRAKFLLMKNATVILQTRFRAHLLMKKIRAEYILKLQTIKTQSAIRVQSWFRMLVIRNKYISIQSAVRIIQERYRLYRNGRIQRQEYLTLRHTAIKVQANIRRHIVRTRYLKLKQATIVVQKIFRMKRLRKLEENRRQVAAVTIQKNVKKFLVQRSYNNYLQKVVFIQKIWRSKLVTRMIRYEFLQRRAMIVKLQALVRGYLLRKAVQCKREQILAEKKERQLHFAASKIQALFRGIRTRKLVSDRKIADLRKRWREGALESNQESLKERNAEAMEILSNVYDIVPVITAFKSLELLTEVFPMLYNDNASALVRRVYIYMSVTNRSISSIEVLKSAAAVLVNLTRYKVTGPKIYTRERIAPVLKFMWRFSNSEIELFCILCTYLWLFSKYQHIKEDLTEYLQASENHKMLRTIKSNVDRRKRMAGNSSKNKFTRVSLSQSMNFSHRDSSVLPALDPDYGITRANKPRYFEDASSAIDCLFNVYKL